MTTLRDGVSEQSLRPPPQLSRSRPSLTVTGHPMQRTDAPRGPILLIGAASDRQRATTQALASALSREVMHVEGDSPPAAFSIAEPTAVFILPMEGTETVPPAVMAIRHLFDRSPFIAIDAPASALPQLVAMGIDDCVQAGQLRPDTLPGLLDLSCLRRRREAQALDRAATLELSEGCLRHLIERNLDGMIITDRRGTVLFANRSAAAILGRNARQLKGHRFGLAVTGIGTPLLRCYKPDGGSTIVELSVAETVWRGGFGLLVSLRDVTRAVETQEALHENEQLTDTIFAAAADGIWGLDANGNTTFINTAGAAMVRADPSKFVGRPFSDVYAPETDSESPCPVTASLADGQTRRVPNQIFRRTDGSQFAVEFTVAPMQGPDDRNAGAVVTFADIGERQLLEAQLLEAQRFEGIGMLAAGIAHEINTPVQYVSDNVFFLNSAFSQILEAVDHGHAEVAHQEASPPNVTAGGGMDLKFLAEEIPSAMEQASEGLERIAGIVRAMKEFSHPGADVPEPVDLNRAIETTVTVCRNEWRYVAEIDLKLDSTLPMVLCHPQKLNQVFLNIIVNAAHAIGEHYNGEKLGRITITTRQLGADVEVAIADDGPGIPDDIRRKIYDPFFTTKPVGKGTGQGLAIARSIIFDLHGGSVDLETQIGNGTTFRIRIPIDRNVKEALADEDLA